MVLRETQGKREAPACGRQGLAATGTGALALLASRALRSSG